MKVAVFGAGTHGTAIAKRAAAAGDDIYLVNSRGPDSLVALATEMGPGVVPATAEGAMSADPELVVVAVRMVQYPKLDPRLLSNCLVVDVGNYYPEFTGPIVAVDEGTVDSTQYLQSLLPDADVARALNTIASAEIGADARPTGSEGRRALPVACDKDDAKRRVMAWVDRLGFEPVDGGLLSDAWRFARDQPAYNQWLDADGTRDALAAARR